MLDFTSFSRINWIMSFFYLSINVHRPVLFLGTLFEFQIVIFHVISVSGNLEYSGMMNQAVENGRCHRTVLNDIPPFGKGNIGHQDGRVHLVLEEEASLLFGNRKITDLIDDEGFIVHIPLQNPFECLFFISRLGAFSSTHDS